MLVGCIDVAPNLVEPPMAAEIAYAKLKALAPGAELARKAARWREMH